MTITELPPAPAVPDPSDVLAQQIRAALLRLAEHPTVDDIASHLAKLGIRGVCGDPGQCAIAAYLDHVVPGLGGGAFYIDPYTWSAFDERSCVDASGWTPLCVGKFIRRFDAGGYPELRTPESPASVDPLT